MNEDALAQLAKSFHVPTTLLKELVGLLRARDNARYEDRGCIGRGGMGEVRRVYDRALERELAMKLIPLDCSSDTLELRRVLREARITARLPHPGIPPIHDTGTLPDGRVYYTMEEIHGETLAEAILRRRRAPTPDNLRLLVEAYQKAADAVAYAHTRGVVHQDIKPANIMLDHHGVVRVIDWGIAQTRGGPALSVAAPVEGNEALAFVPPRTEQTAPPPFIGPTIPVVHPIPDTPQPPGGGDWFESPDTGAAGKVYGTLAYMSPEQLAGGVGPRNDVWSLGVVLYEIIAGCLPFTGTSTQVVEQLRHGAPHPLTAVAPADTPRELVAICARALATPDQRYPDAGALAEAVAGWLSGTQRRRRGLDLMERAVAVRDSADPLRARIATLRTTAEEALAGVETWAPESRKQAGWAAADKADALDVELARLDTEVEHLATAALTQAPELASAHGLLADIHRARHATAEREADIHATQRAELFLRSHVDALPQESPTRQAHLAYLDGSGTVSLVTDPPGAEVHVERFVLRGRRLVPAPAGLLGHTPLVEARLPMGSYQLRIRAPGHDEVRYPVHLRRGEHWDGVRPGDSGPTPIWLPPRGAIDPAFCYVPAGPFLAGGDPDARFPLPARRLWLNAFVMARFATTHGQYLDFLNDLVRRGDVDAAEAFAAHERSGKAGTRGPVCYGRRADGTFELVPDSDGDTWHPDWPVFMIDWWSAQAYTEWLAERCGGSPRLGPPRLPGEAEWEKAARGCDGRLRPWGDHIDPSWTSMWGSAERCLPAPADSFPIDTSVYGVRGLGGNARCWCRDAFDEGAMATEAPSPLSPPSDHAAPNEKRVVRGSGFTSHGAAARSAGRWPCLPGWTYLDIGVRPVRTVLS